MIKNPSSRRYELDWLRVLAILFVFLYHSTRFFNLGDWHVKNVNTYVWVEMWNIFATRWMMPLFFVISGASLFYALGKSGGSVRCLAEPASDPYTEHGQTDFTGIKPGLSAVLDRFVAG